MGIVFWVVIVDYAKVIHILVQLFIFPVVSEPGSLHLLHLTHNLEKPFVAVLFFKHSTYGRVCMPGYLSLSALRVRVSNCMLSK